MPLFSPENKCLHSLKHGSFAVALVFLLVFALSSACFIAPVPAYADEPTAAPASAASVDGGLVASGVAGQNASSEIFTPKDNSKLERFKARVFNGLIDCNTSIDVSDIGISASEITFLSANGGTLTGTTALAGIVRSHVIFQTYCVSWSGFSFEYSGNIITKVAVTYDQYNWGTTITDAFKTSYAEFIDGFPADASDFRKVAYIHDWICNHVSYSMNDTYKPSSAIGAIANGKAVCAGYSYAFQFLCQQVGLECSYISDYPVTVQHAWNKVKVDGQWFYVDTTWDDGTFVGSFATYKYFLLNDTEFAAANNAAHGDPSAWQNAEPINTQYSFANKYWQDKQVPLSDDTWNEDPQLTNGSSEHVHTWGEWKTTKAPTCTAAGTKERTCSTCGATQTETIAAKGHTWKDDNKAATCTEAGYTQKKCSVCGTTKDYVVVKAKGHTWGAWKTTKAASYKEAGTQERTCSVCGTKETQTIAKLTSVTMYRLYNPYSGEHLYTSDTEERDSLTVLGWKYEGLAWTAPSKSNTPVYRLYNKYSGDHHYTTNKSEYDACVKQGWTGEGIGFYSDDAKGVTVYRLYNKYLTAGTHHYTTSKNEYDSLGKIGWSQENIGWYGVKV